MLAPQPYCCGADLACSALGGDEERGAPPSALAFETSLPPVPVVHVHHLFHDVDLVELKHGRLDLEPYGPVDEGALWVDFDPVAFLEHVNLLVP